MNERLEATRRAPHMEKYVSVGNRYGAPHQVILKIGVQSFFVNEPSDTAEEAEWMRNMVCNALDALVKRESAKP